ncbi:MAG: alpha/beta hydrolase domain-containing protein [Actinomycetota bacterium]|nr:alpha/beta hydrolase domain-containing protein [Actinomycetota bacterium]
MGGTTVKLWIVLICVLSILSVGCGSNDVQTTESEVVRDDTPSSAATEEPVESPTTSPSEEPIDGSESEVESLEQDSPKPDGILRTASEITDADGLGSGLLQPLGAAPLPDGYSEVELLIAGEATSYRSEIPLNPEGTWIFEEDTQESYKTRALIRYPPVDHFSGVVIIEWLNVTAGVDNSIDWTYLSEEIGREGHGYVGVSAQIVGVMGRDSGRLPGGLIDTRGLPTRDPVRYGDLTHPGDAFSFDIFTQSALAGVQFLNTEYGSDAGTLIAVGQSQSAAFLTSYINAVHPIVRVFDSYLVHGRGDGAPDPQMNDRLSNVLIRSDVDVPVLIYETETDLNVLEYATARQEDSTNIRSWEVTGAAHADTYSLTYANGFPRQASVGSVIGCPGLINDGPQHETLQAALHHLVVWTTGGDPPSSSPRIEVAIGEKIEIVRDEMGLAVGGIRTPTVSVPLRIFSGDPAVSEGFCFLFGQTFEIDTPTLKSMYPTLESYVSALEAAATESVHEGWLLQVDADIMIEEETARAVSLGIGD